MTHTHPVGIIDSHTSIKLSSTMTSVRTADSGHPIAPCSPSAYVADTRTQMCAPMRQCHQRRGSPRRSAQGFLVVEPISICLWCPLSKEKRTNRGATTMLCQPASQHMQCHLARQAPPRLGCPPPLSAVPDPVPPHQRQKCRPEAIQWQPAVVRCSGAATAPMMQGRQAGVLP